VTGVKQRRPAIPRSLQLRVFRRDGWLCRWCRRPVIFPPVMKYLEHYVRGQGHTGTLAYFDLRWRRDAAPLLDHLAAVVDHVEARSGGGADDELNYATACNKCNARKSAGPPKEPKHIVKGRYGEPKHWDGLSSVFVALFEQDPKWNGVTKSERDWHKVLTAAAGPAAAAGHGTKQRATTSSARDRGPLPSASA